ncbi:MAG TPA: hypothetical protein VGN42_11670 [Pirellulales bacterium]|nr:hypothetical protein [Pirellulales bacterium]
MRSTLLNRSNSNILGIRQDRRVAAVKNVLGAAVALAQSFFFRHACETPAQYLTAKERQMKRAVVGKAQTAVAMLMSPASHGPQCWHAAHPARQPALGS